MTNKLTRILILTVNNVYKHINIKPSTFKNKYNKHQKFPEDKRINVYQKKVSYYKKENIPLNLRRIKQKHPEEYSDAQEDYMHYIEAKSEQKEAAKERRIEKKKAEQTKKKQQQKQETQQQPIRVWMKLKYTKNNPIFIEAFIDGRTKDEADLKEQLQEFIASNFNEGISFSTEIGIENISRIEQTSPDIKYKHGLSAGWNTL